mmetsp:Transcript_5492/g.20040  ORF Transcript_5492/g.20040 Transcript_5492/m.20040 type:complete len:136 (-) Transcript_5492:1073-1480(-)
MDEDDVRATELYCCGFNQDAGCYACGTDKGFRIYNCEPFKETFRREFSNGLRIVEMLYRCNILAVVGGGRNPQYPPNKVMIWDDHQGRCIGELNFRSEVRCAFVSNASHLRADFLTWIQRMPRTRCAGCACGGIG